MKFGMPYKGSKNSIVQHIIDVMPPAEHFYDLFGGGGAISYCALLSGKYKYVHYNELDPLVFKGFKMAVNGEFENENRWISREDFFKLKDTDPYVAICFSFGNNLKTYCYSREIEPFKKALHNAIVLHNFTELNKILAENKLELVNTSLTERKDITRAVKDVLHKHVRSQDVEAKTRLESLERLQSLERLERLNNLNDIKNIVCTNLSYDELDFETDSVIYCDPPYINTEGYLSDFNHKKFYSWCKKQRNIFISEYTMPDDFLCLGAVNKNVTLDRNNKAKKKQEKLFTNNHYEEMFILC